MIRRIFAAFGLLGYFVRELVASSCRVAYDALTPTRHMCPALLRVPYRVHGDGRIALFANLVSLTPGTLVVDVLEDRRELLVHTMFRGAGPEALRHQLRTGFEDRIIAVFGDGAP